MTKRKIAATIWVTWPGGLCEVFRTFRPDEMIRALKTLRGIQIDLDRIGPNGDNAESIC